MTNNSINYQNHSVKDFIAKLYTLEVNFFHMKLYKIYIKQKLLTIRIILNSGGHIYMNCFMINGLAKQRITIVN